MSGKDNTNGTGHTHGGKILSFRQDTDFFLTRAEKELDRNDLLAATERYRKAYLSDPSDLDACLALADMLGRMQRYEESNRLLLVDMSMNDADPESFFGLACNYYGMQEFAYARECLETYLAMAPEGNYAADAEEFLEVLNDEDELRYSLGNEAESSETLTVCVHARRLSDTDRNDEAAKLLTEYLTQYPEALRAKHTLATVRYIQGNTDEALRLVDEVIRKDRFNVCARCSKVFFLRQEKRSQEADMEMDAALALRVDYGAEELGAIGLLQIEAEQWEQARDTYEKLLEFLPYEPTVLHHLALARYMLNDTDGASGCYRTLLRIDPDDTVAAFYVSYCKKKTKGKKYPFPPTYQVPLTEVLRRMHHISDAISVNRDTFLARWKNDRAFRNLLVWGVNLGGDSFTAEMLKVIATAGDLDAERVIRDFLLRSDRCDEMKHFAASLLGHISPDKNVMLFLDGAWIRAELNEINGEVKLPAIYEQMLGKLANMVSTENCSQATVEAIGGIMHTIYEYYHGILPKMTKDRMLATAAALELIGREQSGELCELNQLSARYRVTERRVRNAVERIKRILALMKEETL